MEARTTASGFRRRKAKSAAQRQRPGSVRSDFGLFRLTDFRRIASRAFQIKLQLVQMGVKLAPGEQLVVSTALLDQPVLQHEDLISLAHGGKPMCDDEGRPPLH